RPSILAIRPRNAKACCVVSSPAVGRANANPVVGEEDALAGVDPRHVAVDASLPGSHGTERLRPSPVAAQAGGLVAGAIGRGPAMGVVTGDATEAALAPGVALRLHQSHRLEPGQPGLVAADHLGGKDRRVAVALAAETKLRVGGPLTLAERHRQILRTPARR